MVAAMPQAVLEQIVRQIPIGALVQPDEVARCVAFLASEDAGFITGSVISANGGMYMA
jgi:acetoacetyl-CoA reductase